jgi:hypothetical protein
MSRKSHRSDLTILAILGVATVLVILALMSAGWLRKGEEGGDTSASTQSRNVEGTLVAYTLLERLGYSVARSERPLLAEELASAAVVVVLHPQVHINGGEVAALQEWVRAGGVLVCTDDVGGLLTGERSAGPPVPVQGAFRFVGTVPPTAGDLPLARDVAVAEFATPLTLDLHWEDADAPESVTQLFVDTAGPRIAGIRLGSGDVITVSDSSFLANGRIGQADDAVLATNLVAYALSVAQGGSVVFDEYHQGFGAHESGIGAMAVMLFRTRPGWAVLSLAAAGLLYLVYKGRRFGPRRGLERTRRRSKLEYVNAVGETYRAAGAHGLVLGIILRWFRGEAAARAGVPPSADFSLVAGRLAQRTGKPAARYERAVRECEAALAGRGPSGRRLSTLLNGLAQIELEMRDERRTGK